MDEEHPQLGTHLGDFTETMDTSLSPHTTATFQPTTDNRMSSGTPEADEDNGGSEPRPEDSRTNTPASDIPPSDAGSDLRPSDGSQDAANTTDAQVFYKRELRPTRGTAPCTWIDADTTGDFDPREEARKARPRRKKAKISHRGNHDWNGGEHTNEPAIEFRHELPPPPALCIRFNSSAGKLAFGELCANLHHEVKPTCDNWTAGYQLRKRKSIREDHLSSTLSVQASGVRVIASEQTSDFTNHPVARGCFDCLAMGTRCSLLDNEHSWPCEECELNDNDCHLVKVCRSPGFASLQFLMYQQEPELKMACTHCQYLGKKQKWLVCSFEYNQDPSSHRGRCVECQEGGHRPCIAGPRPGHVLTRKRIGPDNLPYENKPSNTQKASRKTTCLQCLESRRVCSFKIGTLHGDGRVCTACDMAGEACEPLGSRTPQHRHQRSPQDSVHEESKELDVEEGDDVELVSNTLAADQTFAQPLTNSPEPPADTLEPEQGDAKMFVSVKATPVHDQTATRATKGSSAPREDSPEVVCGTIKTVRTKLCHPVRFDHVGFTDEGSNPCHFCDRAAYSIIGLPDQIIQVVEWDDGRGWEEVSSGHRDEGIEATQVCPDCTMSRMKIMVCDEHALRRIEGVNNKEQDLLEAMDRLVEEGERGTWCSVCCNLPVWKCCLEQQIEGGEGCGLLLCEPCFEDLERCDGSFEAMLQQLGDKPKDERRILGLRADYELLKQDGLLTGYLRYSAAEE